jgi:hypothetical protein
MLLRFKHLESACRRLGANDDDGVFFDELTAIKQYGRSYIGNVESTRAGFDIYLIRGASAEPQTVGAAERRLHRSAYQYGGTRMVRHVNIKRTRYFASGARKYDSLRGVVLS